MAGARYFKADLQMQTPVDRNRWRGPERLTPTSTREEREAVARAFVDRCYSQGLEVIAVTEHNLAPDDCPSLVPEIVAAASDLASDYGYSLVVFPGFEVATTIGSGIHVLCIFEPGTTIATVSEKLTQLGLPSGNRFDDGLPRPTPVSANVNLDVLTRVIQEDPGAPGLVLLAHANSERGVLDGNRLVQWWSAEVISDERLLCMELPNPREHYLGLSNQPLVKSVLENVDTRYRRRHPMASICSSDCKSLEALDDDRNYIGWRYTWIKMGAPTIEGLRQAFLDHGSRVRFGEKNPDERSSHPRLVSVEVENADFLADQTVEFSPNMSVIIGGSGTGKSTIVNYMRMCLGQDSKIRGSDVQANSTRSLQTISNSTRIRVRGEMEGEGFEVSSTGRVVGTVGPEGSRFAGQSPAAVVPVRFFGQREIYSMATDREAITSLVDDVISRDLASIFHRVAVVEVAGSSAAGSA